MQESVQYLSNQIKVLSVHSYEITSGSIIIILTPYERYGTVHDLLSKQTKHAMSVSVMPTVEPVFMLYLYRAT